MNCVFAFVWYVPLLNRCSTRRSKTGLGYETGFYYLCVVILVITLQIDL